MAGISSAAHSASFLSPRFEFGKTSAMMRAPTASARAEGAAPEDVDSTSKSQQASFSAPIRSYDVHVYFFQGNKRQTEHARALREEILQTFPHMRTYGFHEKPIGPHPTGMFETDIDSPEDFGVFVPWITMRRGDLSILVHPNTGNDLEDHTTHAIWIGDKMPLDTDILKRVKR